METTEMTAQSWNALQSETWQEVREDLQPEVKHFTAGENTIENAYGAVWAEVVKEYLQAGYSAEGVQQDITVLGETYKALKRDKVTAFYDADGNTLFDVENERLETEYAWAEALPTNAEDEARRAESKEQSEDAMQSDKSGDAAAKGADQENGAKSYASGEEKLLAEEHEMLASVKPEFKKVMQAQLDLIFTELIKETKQDTEFEQEVLRAHKSMKRCMKFCAEKAAGLRNPSEEEKAAARERHIPIMTPVTGDILLGWIKEYYGSDDKAEVEKEQKAAQAQKKRTSKKKTTEKKKAAAKEKVSQKQEKQTSEKKEKSKAQTSKKQDKLVNGQVSMFDLFEA